MTNKTKTQIQLLREYCDNRFDLQDNYYESKMKSMKRWTIIAFVFVTCILIGLATTVDKTEKQVFAQEGCYEECRAD